MASDTGKMQTAIQATPGPWTLQPVGDIYHLNAPAVAGGSGSGGWFLLLDAGCGEAFQNAVDPEETRQEFEANARLIAAAPEMLEALRVIAGGDGDAQVIAQQTLGQVGLT